MKLLFEFLKKVFNQWIFWLAVLPKIYDILEAYFSFDIKLPQAVTNPLVVIGIFYAIFSVWKEEKISKLLLEEKLKNPTDFDITANLISFTLDENIKSFESRLDKEYKKVEKFKKKQIEALVVDRNDHKDNNSFIESLQISTTISQSQKKAEKEMQKLISPSFPRYTKSQEQYNTEMKIYRDNLTNFYKDYYNRREEMLEKIKLCLHDKYFITFEVKNIGNTSDENIDITINTGNHSIYKKFSTPCKCLKFISKKPDKPEPPKEINRFEKNFNFNDLLANRPYIPYSPNAYRRNYEIKNNNISVILREMNVGDAVDILKDVLIIDLEGGKQQMDFIIKSKKSNLVIKKNIVCLFEDNSKMIYN